jgi:pyrimidine-nucleoside phosphorylase
MVDIGLDAGRKMVALLSDMNQPLGEAVGNALEVKEAIATLQGEGSPHLWAHSQEVAAQMLRLADKAESVEAAKEILAEVRANGRAFNKFREMVAAQGGDLAQVDDVSKLPQAKLVERLLAPQSGTIAGMDTGEIGWAIVRLGGGRLKKYDKIYNEVGLLLHVKIGDTVEAGDEIGAIHANDADKLEQARQEILAAISWSDGPVAALPHLYGTVE